MTFSKKIPKILLESDIFSTFFLAQQLQRLKKINFLFYRTMGYDLS